MQCPIDGAQLVMTERAGVEIDYCPQCRGVWLDRGELDKIIERSAAPEMPPQPPQPPQPQRQDPYMQQQGDPRGGYSGHPYKKKKQKSFLSEIFDFD